MEELKQEKPEGSAQIVPYITFDEVPPSKVITKEDILAAMNAANERDWHHTFFPPYSIFPPDMEFNAPITSIALP